MSLMFRYFIMIPLGALLILAAMPRLSGATPTAHLILDAQPGDFVGPGSGHFDITYTPLNSDFFSAQIQRTIGSAPAQPAEALFLMAHWVSHIVYVAAKLSVADYLTNGPKLADELAGPTETQAPALYRLMKQHGRPYTYV